MKIYEELIRNLHEVDDESFVKGLLLEYNVNKIFSPIYAFDKAKDVRHFGNVCTSFIILAYSNGCKWLDYRKDRIQVKLEVLNSILDAGKIQLDDVWSLWFNNLVDGEYEEIEKVIYDYVEWQKDDKFYDYIALSTQISLCRRKSSNTFGVTEKMLNDRGKFLADLPQLRADLKNIITEIEVDYMPLNESLKQESNKSSIPISERIVPRKWEDVVNEYKNK